MLLLLSPVFLLLLGVATAAAGAASAADSDVLAMFSLSSCSGLSLALLSLLLLMSPSLLLLESFWVDDAKNVFNVVVEAWGAEHCVFQRREWHNMQLVA